MGPASSRAAATAASQSSPVQAVDAAHQPLAGLGQVGEVVVGVTRDPPCGPSCPTVRSVRTAGSAWRRLRRAAADAEHLFEDTRHDTDARRDRSGRPAHHPGRAGAQPEGRLARPAARRPHRLHRAVRLRQVQPGLRHHLRRGPAPLRRVALGVRPAVPRPDGQARRRLHRGPLARGLDRPEVHLEEPALDGRHDHRGLRLPAAAVRPHRPPPLPDLRRADRAADAAADRRPGARARGGPPVPGARAGDPRPQGRVRRAVPPAADAGLLPGPRRRRDPPARRPAQARQAEASTRSRSSSTGSRSRSPPSGGSPTRSRPRSTSPAAWCVLDFVDLDAKDPGRELRFSEKMSCPNDHPIDTDELEPRSFSFNSPFGACPECHGLGTRLEVDPELVVPDPTASLGEGAIQPWSQAHVADYFQRLLDALGDELGFDLDTPWEELTATAAEVAAVGPPHQGPRRHPQPLRPRALLLRRSSRACRATSSGATARPSPTPAASASRASCARCRARRAAAPGSSRSRSR